MSYEGTIWQRKSDGATIQIKADSEAASGGGNRYLRAVNTVSKKSFWVTPEGLRRKYRLIEDRS